MWNVTTCEIERLRAEKREQEKKSMAYRRIELNKPTINTGLFCARHCARVM